MTEEKLPSEPPPEELIPVGKLLNMITGQALAFVILGLGIWVLSGRDVVDFASIDVEQVLLGCGIAAGLMGVAAATLNGFPKFSEKLSRMQGTNFAFLEHGFSMPVIIWISICAGFGEEALFRAGLQTLAGDYMSAPFAIILTSIIFAAVHLSKPLVSAFIFVIGALFGYIYWQTGSFLAVAIGHTLYDVFALWYLQRELHRIGFFKELARKRELARIEHEPETSSHPQA